MNIVEFTDGEVILKVKHKAFIALKGKRSYTTESFYKEMFYVYNVCDYNAAPSRGGFNEMETHNYAIEAAGLPSNFIPDIKVGNAIKAYFSLRDTSVINYLRELYKSMAIGANTVKVLNDVNEELLSEAVKIKVANVDDLSRKSDLTSKIADNLKILFEMASKAQSYVDNLKSLIEKAKIEEEKIDRGLGNTPITSSMIPDEY